MGRLAPGLLLVLLLSALVPAALADGPAVPERRLVTFQEATPVAGSLVGGARVLESFPFAGIALVSGAPDALARLATLSGVAGVYREEPITLHLDRARAIVNAGDDARGPGGALEGLDGAGVTVALVDSGLDVGHPAFAGRVAASVRISSAGGVSDSSIDDEGHGTHVAGILGGNGAMSRGERLHGLAPAARLVGVDISDSFTTTSAVRAFAWIHEHREEHGIQIVSNSWGREKDDARYDPDDPVIRASDALVSDGMVVIFSAGNRGRDGEATLTPEAMNPNVITVGSASPQGRRESYSSQGPATDARGDVVAWTKPDVMAPGSAILSTRTSASAPEGSDGEERYYVVMNGTSMAAPQVAAAAALLRQQDPTLTPALVQAILQGTARDLGDAGPDAATGYGMLDVAGAASAARLLDEGTRLVTVERSVPVRVTGHVAAAASLVLLAGDKPLLPPAEEITLPLVAPAQAARSTLWLNWSGPGSFEATLHDARDERAFDRVATGSLRFDGALAEGAYRVVLRPTGIAAETAYTLEGSVLVREERVVEVPSEFHARPFIAQGGFYLPETGAQRVMSVIGQAPFLALALMSGLACVVGLRLRKR